jgi:ankyrin repeat protein
VHRRTPLHWAALADAGAVARMLLERGADGRAVDAGGATAMDLAVENDCAQVLRVFVSFQGDARGC